MVKKIQKTASKKKPALPLGSSVKESAQQIWLAGLGAFNKAQAESGKAYENLLKEGLAIQRKTQAAAEEKITEATSKMSGMASGLSAKATGITSLATGQWDKLENIFELRVAKALKKLGVPSSQEVADLVKRVEELNKSVQKLSKAGGVKPAPTTAAAKPVVKAVKAAAKPVARPVAKKAAKAIAPAVAAVVAAVEEVAPEVKAVAAPVKVAKPAAKRVAARKPVEAVEAA